MEVGCLKYPGASTIGSQPLDWNNAPMTGTTAQPSHEPPHQRKGTGTRHTEKKNISGENPTSLGGGWEGKKMADRTQHEGKTERAKESHDRCSQPPGMRMPKTADLGTQALLVVNSFKLHLNAFKHFSSWSIIALLKGFDQRSIIINDQHTTQTNLHVFRRRDVKARPNPICRNHSRTMHNVFFGFGYSTIIWRNKQQQQQQQQQQQNRLSFMYTNSTPRGTLNKCLYGETPPRGPTTYHFLYHFFFTKKVPLSYTFYWKMVPLSQTLFRSLHPF